MDTKKQTALKDLQQIPGIGPALSEMLYQIGITKTSQLKNKNPEKLYEKLCNYKAAPVDRCVLYTFRAATYYASNKTHDKQKLLWQNWKD